MTDATNNSSKPTSISNQSQLKIQTEIQIPKENPKSNPQPAGKEGEENLQSKSKANSNFKYNKPSNMAEFK